MKKKVIFNKPADLVGIEEINPYGVFLAVKNENKAILTNGGTWISLDGSLTVITHLCASNMRDAITNAEKNGATVYQYDSFYDLCKDFIEEE